MKADEKKCPKCAETIKLEAIICKHCRHEFSKAEENYMKVKSARQAKTRRPKARSFENEMSRDEAIATELTARAKLETITPSICGELAEEYRLTTRSIMTRAVLLGLPYRLTNADLEETDDNDDEEEGDEVVEIARRPDVDFRSTAPNTMQYGVLQGPANLLGGCASLWGWAILIFLVAAMFALVTGQLT